MSVKIGSARIDERGKISGGTAGDNTGKEVSFQNWYKHSKGWIVLRAKDDTIRDRIAYAMRAACTNNNIGYDQSNRSGLYNAVKNVGWDPAKCTTKTETDCSALVRVCTAYAIQKAVADFNTASQVNTLMNTGYFEKLTDSKYTNQENYLLEGDILVTKTKGHTAVVLNDGDKAAEDALGVAQATLKKGSKGTEVMKLQKNLNEAIDAKLDVDGSFGGKTYDALCTFQTKYGLSVDGIYGPKSEAKMVDVLSGKVVVTDPVKVATYTLRKGNKGSNVKTLQDNLNRLGANLVIDGSFGPATEAAVKEFQKKFCLVVDGVYGKNSYTKMKSLLNA